MSDEQRKRRIDEMMSRGRAERGQGQACDAERMRAVDMSVRGTMRESMMAERTGRKKKKGRVDHIATEMNAAQ